MTEQILDNAITYLELGIEASKDELDFYEVIDLEDILYVFDVNCEIVKQSNKLKILREFRNILKQ